MGDLRMGRRSFIKTSSAAFGALGLSSLFELSHGARAAAPPTRWDRECDLVVVGSGTGSLGALYGLDAGLSVIVLEKGRTFGGTTARSGGGMWIPANYLMAEAGIKDSEEAAFEYMKKATFGQSEEALMRAYLRTAPHMLLYLRKAANLEFQFLMGTGLMFSDYYMDVFEGAQPRGRTVQPANGGGQVLMEAIREAIERRGGPVLYNTAATSLIVDEAGAVIGVRAKGPQGEIAIRARRGVLLAAGGFDWNAEMVRHFLRGPIYYPSAVSTNTGDGILMGMAVGADLRNMNECWGWPVYEVPLTPGRPVGIPDAGLERGKPGAIIVNRWGQRFCNESSNYDSMARTFYWWDSSIFDYRNIPAFVITDSEHRKRYTLAGMKPGVVQPWMNPSSTLEELAGKLGIDPQGLKATVEQFNQFARQGKDPHFRRGEFTFDRQTTGDPSRTELRNPCLAPIETPPYYGVPMYPGSLGTCGGLRINAHGQVLTPFGEPIEGLYATGNNAGSVMGAGYPGGGATIGAGFVFAYLAAQHMARKA